MTVVAQNIMAFNLPVAAQVRPLQRFVKDPCDFTFGVTFMPKVIMLCMCVGLLIYLFSEFIQIHAYVTFMLYTIVLTCPE